MERHKGRTLLRHTLLIVHSSSYANHAFRATNSPRPYNHYESLSIMHPRAAFMCPKVDGGARTHPRPASYMTTHAAPVTITRTSPPGPGGRRAGGAHASRQTSLRHSRPDHASRPTRSSVVLSDTVHAEGTVANTRGAPISSSV